MSHRSYPSYSAISDLDSRSPTRYATATYAQQTETPAAAPILSDKRLWAEQLAAGMALLMAILIFLALFHSSLLSSGMAVLGPNELAAYGWASVFGIFSQIIVHELGSIAVAWWKGLPLRLRFFCFGATAGATLAAQPRDIWRDAVVGFAGPFTGTALSGAFALTYMATDNPLFLGMACVGYFYNLFTLIPILYLEGGWLAPALAPQAWLLAVVGMVVELTNVFNLVLLCVFVFALPRFVMLVLARAPRTDLPLTTPQRALVGIGYVVLILALAWFGSTTFDKLPGLVRESMGD